jgi:hypothetical protein
VSLDTRAGATCPDDESLGAWIEARLAPATQEELERHVASCPTCLDVVASALATSNAETTAAAVPTPVRPGVSLRWLALAASLLIAIGVGYAGARVALERGRAAIAARASETLRMPIAIGSMTVLAGNLDGVRLRLGDVRLGDTVVDALDVELAAAALLRGTIEIAALHLHGASLDLRGANVAGQAAPLVALASVPDVPKVTLDDVQLRIDPGPLGGAPLSLAGVRGEMSLGDPTAVAIDFTAAVAGGTMRLRGDIGRSPATLALELTADTLDATTLAGRRIAGPADVHASITGPVTDPRVHGTVRIAPATLTGIVLPVPPTAVSPRGAPLSIDELHAAFAWRHRVLRLRRLHLATPTLTAGASLQLLPNRTLTGTGTAALSSPTPATLPFTITGTLDSPRLIPTAR